MSLSMDLKQGMDHLTHVQMVLLPTYALSGEQRVYFLSWTPLHCQGSTHCNHNRDHKEPQVMPEDRGEQSAGPDLPTSLDVALPVQGKCWR